MKEYKILIFILVKFFTTLLVFWLLGYNYYLNYFNEIKKTCDPFTELVADQSIALSNFFGLVVEKGKADPFPYISLLFQGERFAIVNEGCNALSVIIFFVAFIFALSSKFSRTLLFILLGIIILHISNIVRISLLSYINIFHHQYEKITHDYLFPAIIYGTVIILWLIWIKFGLKEEKKE